MTRVNPSIPPTPGLLAAVDLGSNSFRLLIGRVDRSELGEQIRPIDSLKDAVRLAAGLGADGRLDVEAQQRGLQALARFGERLRSFAPDTVRVVATNTLRIASNAQDFLDSAEAILGFPISVISGREEARLIYLGAAHELPLDSQYRLVVDIGGGSTECIIGKNYQPRLLESAGVGCVALTNRHFGDGEIDRKRLQHARFAARDVFAPYAGAFRRQGWSYAVGTSGTAKALIQYATQVEGATELRLEHLESLAGALAKAGHVDRLKLDGIKPDRRPVLAGGVATMLALFDEFGIRSLRYCPGALRQGVLYDLLGRNAGDDMRRITVARMIDRYGIDAMHARLVAQCASAMFAEVATLPHEEAHDAAILLEWAAQLAEVGLSISHESYHKHSAYILLNADMPGFSRGEQDVLSHLTLGQTGGLRKLRAVLSSETEWLMVFCLRVAMILHRHRDGDNPSRPVLSRRGAKLAIAWPAQWADTHPLTHETLIDEVATWNEFGPLGSVAYLEA